MSNWVQQSTKLLFKLFFRIVCCLVLSDEGPMLETLNYTIRIGSTPIFLYFEFDLYLYSAYAAHYVYLTIDSCLICCCRSILNWRCYWLKRFVADSKLMLTSFFIQLLSWYLWATMTISIDGIFETIKD